MCAEVVNEVEGVTVLEGRPPEGHVGDSLGEDAAESQHDAGPELLVPDQSGDEFPVAVHHRADEQPDLSVLGSGSGQQVGGRRTGLIPRREAQSDEAALGLVGDGVATELDNDREPECLSGLGSRPGVGGRRPRGHRHAGVFDESARVGFGQGGHRECLARAGGRSSGGRAYPPSSTSSA